VALATYEQRLPEFRATRLRHAADAAPAAARRGEQLLPVPSSLEESRAAIDVERSGRNRRRPSPSTAKRLIQIVTHPSPWDRITGK